MFHEFNLLPHEKRYLRIGSKSFLLNTRSIVFRLLTIYYQKENILSLSNYQHTLKVSVTTRYYYFGNVT